MECGVWSVQYGVWRVECGAASEQLPAGMNTDTTVVVNKYRSFSRGNNEGAPPVESTVSMDIRPGAQT